MSSRSTSTTTESSSPSEALRAAATRLRRLASKEGLDVVADWTASDVTGWACDGGWITEWDEEAGNYIAAVRPEVGLALADWLDQCAEIAGADAPGVLKEALTEHALVIAQLVNETK